MAIVFVSARPVQRCDRSRLALTVGTARTSVAVMVNCPILTVMVDETVMGLAGALSDASICTCSSVALLGGGQKTLATDVGLSASVLVTLAHSPDTAVRICQAQ